MYFVRRLMKLKIDNKIVCLFFNSVVSSVLVYASPCWLNSCGSQKKAVCKFARRMIKTVGNCADNIENPTIVSSKKCVSLISKIIKDQAHPLYPCITILPHGRLRSIKCKTERFKKSFLPSAINLFNSKKN